MNDEKIVSDTFLEEALNGKGDYAIAYAVLKLTEAQKSVSLWVKYLGGGDNADAMGAIEFLAVRLGEGLEGLASAIRERER